MDVVAPSFDDLITQGKAEALAIRDSLAFVDGDITEAQMHGAGAMADMAIRQDAQNFRNTFIDGAEGDALTALVDDHTNIQRDPETAAAVTLTFSRTSGGAAVTLLAGFVVASAIDSAGNSVQFTTDANVTFALGSNAPHTVAATAQVGGRAGNVAAGTITRLVSSVSDTTIAVTNVAAAAGGNEEESDPALRVRARNFWTTLRRGTLGALEQGALEISSVRIVRAIEDEDTGITTLVVSDEDGASTAQMVSDVRANLENWRAAGSRVLVVGGTPLLQDVTGTYTTIDGVDPLVLAPLGVAAITAKMRKLRQGETLTIDMLKAAGISVDPDAIEAMPISVPAANVTPLSYQVIRPGTITITGT